VEDRLTIERVACFSPASIEALQVWRSSAITAYRHRGASLVTGYFFSSACQFNTMVKGAWAWLACSAGAKKRNRLPSIV
jgi:hypothetical protein